jgi:uncharacterized protein YyaL (SSP411 family)
MNKVEQSIGSLDKWLDGNGWRGYDPYDIRGKKPFLFLQKNRYSQFVLELVLKRYHMLLRKILAVKKQINAKGMALLARAYLNLYKKRKSEEYLQKALDCLTWLEENPSEGYSGFCWGYPFDWQTLVLIPKGTPSVVVTSMAAHAFLDAYEAVEDSKYLEIAESCCSFILHDLNIDHVDEDRVCFSYTPVDRFHVHNANLFAASALTRTYSHSRNNLYKTTGLKAVNFTASYQNNDGSWYYHAPPDTSVSTIDNYHTGFVLECLNICRRALGTAFKYKDQLKAGLEFYAKNLFLDEMIPKIRPDSTYPIDIHSCAQAIITFYELSDFNGKYLQIAKKVANWTIRNMQDEEGYFYYRIYRNHVDKTPYIRWGEAWMMRGLSYLS